MTARSYEEGTGGRGTYLTPAEAARNKDGGSAGVQGGKAPVIFMIPPKKEEKKAVATPEPPVVENHKSKARPFVSASMPFQKYKEKRNGVKTSPK